MSLSWETDVFIYVSMSDNEKVKTVVRVGCAVTFSYSGGVPQIHVCGGDRRLLLKTQQSSLHTSVVW